MKKLTIYDILAALYIAKYRVITLVLAIWLIVILAIVQMKNIYEANVVLIPARKEESSANMLSLIGGGVAGVASASLGLKDPNAKIVGILKSKRIRDSIITKCDLRNELLIKDATIINGILDKQTSIKVDNESGFINVAVLNENANLAAKIALAYANELKKIVQQLEYDENNDRLAFVEKKLAIQKSKLDSIESVIKSFQMDNRLLDPRDFSKKVSDNLSLIENTITQKEAELSRLKSFLTDENPEVKKINNELQSLQNKKSVLENGDVDGVSTTKLPNIYLKYMDLMRNQKQAEYVFENLSKQYEINKLDVDKRALTVQILEYPTIADKPIKPKRKILFVVSFFVSLLFSLVVMITIFLLRKIYTSQKEKIWSGIQKAKSDV